MPIRITKREDSVRPVEQRKPLAEALYVPPHGRAEIRPGRLEPNRTQPEIRAHSVTHPALESTQEDGRDANTPAEKAHASPPASARPQRKMGRPPRSVVGWLVGSGVFLALLLLLVLLPGVRRREARNAIWTLGSAGPTTETGVAVTDTIGSLMDQRVEPIAGEIDDLYDQMAALRTDVNGLRRDLPKSGPRPTWQWDAEPNASDNPVIPITLTMTVAEVVDKATLARLSNLRTGQSLLVVLETSDNRYTGVFKGFHDAMPVKSDMLSLQAGDYIVVEWLTDMPTLPSVLSADDILPSADKQGADTPPPGGAGEAS